MMGGEEECFVEHDLILARSVTYAQRMQKALQRAGIRCRVFRAPRGMTPLGCAYVVQFRAQERAHALTVLHGAGLDPVQILQEDSKGHGEASP